MAAWNDILLLFPVLSLEVATWPIFEMAMETANLLFCLLCQS